MEQYARLAHFLEYMSNQLTIIFNQFQCLFISKLALKVRGGVICTVQLFTELQVRAFLPFWRVAS